MDIMAIRVGEFSSGGTKLERFLPFLCQKLSESFSIFFSLKNINLGAHSLLNIDIF
jgi:hypothetical protein